MRKVSKRSHPRLRVGSCYWLNSLPALSIGAISSQGICLVEMRLGQSGNRQVVTQGWKSVGKRTAGRVVILLPMSWSITASSFKVRLWSLSLS